MNIVILLYFSNLELMLFDCEVRLSYDWLVWVLLIAIICCLFEFEVC